MILSVKKLLALLLVSFFVVSLYALPTAKKIQKVLLVVAMNKEAKTFISTFNLTPEPEAFPHLPIRAYSGQYDGIQLFLVLNGEDPMYKVQNVGTEAATLATYLGIEQFQPDLIISIGSAGGIPENNANLKDVFVSDKIYFYDRRINGNKNYSEYGLGGYASYSFPEEMIKKLNLKVGSVCTGNSFEADHTDKEIMLKNKCAVIDMEAAGVAWVSMLKKIPMVAIKGVTNLSGSKQDKEQYEKNFQSVIQLLSAKLKGILQFLAKGV